MSTRSMLRLGVVVAIAVATQAARAGETTLTPGTDARARAGEGGAPLVSGYDAFGTMDAVASYGTTPEAGQATGAAGGYDPYVKMDAVPSTTGGSATTQADDAFVQRIWWGP